MTDPTTTPAADRPHPTDLNTPWTLAFDRDGTEDFGVICDADDREIVSSQHCKTCWLPEEDGDDVPVLVRQMLVMAAAPRLLAAGEAVLASWERGDLAAAICELADAVAQARGLAA